MLDKLSKKILKIMASGHVTELNPYSFDGDLTALAAKLSSDEDTVRASIRFLHQMEYIQYAASGGHTWGFFLDHMGLHYKEFQWQDRIEYLREKWIDFFALLVAAAALVISIIALLLPPQG